MDSYATGNVTCYGDNREKVGGLIGNMEGGNIEGCYSKGNVLAESTKHVGGLCGYYQFGNIKRSMSSGTVVGKERVGGFVGSIGKYTRNNRKCIFYRKC